MHEMFPLPQSSARLSVIAVLSVTFRPDIMHFVCVFFVAKRISEQQKQAAIDIADESQEDSFGKYNLLLLQCTSKTKIIINVLSYVRIRI